MSTLNLTKFLLARIAEDEAVARVAGEPPWDEWRYDDGGEVYHAESLRKDPDNRCYLNGVTCDSEGLSPSVTEDVGPHIARFDPARILAECESHRRIVGMAQEFDSNALCVEGEGWSSMYDGEDMLLALAMAYADHPDYREEWRA